MAKFLASRGFMLFLTCATLLLLLFLLYERIGEVLATFRFGDTPQFLDDGETIAILLVGLGVVLESRTTLLRKSRQGTHAGPEKPESERDLDFDYYGIVILIIGLLIEIGAQFIHFVNARLGLEGTPLVARILMQGLGVVAFLVLIRIIILLLTPEPAESLPEN